MELGGGVALVTGAGSGIGRATAQCLAAEGMDVFAVDLDGEAAAATAASFGGQSVAADVSDPFALETAFAECLHRFGRLDVAHLNAGVSLPPGDIGLLDVVNYRRSLEVNVDHVVFGTGLAVQSMRAGPRDGFPRAVIATSSMAGIDPFFPNAIYTLTKHAVVGFIRALAPDLAAEGIGAHVICPGLTDTAQLPPDRRELLLEAGMPLIEPETRRGTRCWQLSPRHSRQQAPVGSSTRTRNRSPGPSPRFQARTT